VSAPGRRPLPQRPTPDPTPAASPQSEQAHQTRKSGRLRRFDSRSWAGAIVLMGAFTALLWIVELINSSDGYRLDRFGVRARTAAGLWGIVTQPFLHRSAEHLASNTLPVILIGWVVMLAGLRNWLVVTTLVVVVGGAVTWLIGPTGTVIVGASSMVFGWMGYLLARALFSRRIKWILVAVAVLFFYGTLLAGLFPTLHSNAPWQANLGGFVAGVVAGAVLHPRGRDSRLTPRTVVL
jgi:membrane associated rhomboid family serine protease